MLIDEEGEAQVYCFIEIESTRYWFLEIESEIRNFSK